MPKFILLYSSDCTTVQFVLFQPCDPQDLNARLCQSRELSKNRFVEGKVLERSTALWGAGGPGQHYWGTWHSPGTGELVCPWQLCPQLHASAATERECLCHPLCECRTCVFNWAPHTLSSYSWSDPWWLVGCVRRGVMGWSGVTSFSEAAICMLFSLQEKLLAEYIFKDFLQWMCHMKACHHPVV